MAETYSNLIFDVNELTLNEVTAVLLITLTAHKIYAIDGLGRETYAVQSLKCTMTRHTATISETNLALHRCVFFFCVYHTNNT